jgi:hypothetical protein
VATRLRTGALRTVRACGDTFLAILIALEDRLAELVTLDREFRGFADGRAQGPVTAAAGPDGDDGSVWGHALFEPVAGAVAERGGAEEAVAVAVAGSGGDLALVCGCDGDGVHVWAFLSLGSGCR